VLQLRVASGVAVPLQVYPVEPVTQPVTVGSAAQELVTAPGVAQQ
jgi:hypothetical protein